MLAGVGLTNCLQLKEPVFLKLYGEYGVSGAGQVSKSDVFALQYITNRSDRRQIRQVLFQEKPTLHFYPVGENQIHGQLNASERESGVYRVCTVWLQAVDAYASVPENGLELSNATIVMSDESVLHARLGRILLYREREMETPLFVESMSVGGDTSMTDYMAQQNMELIRITSPLLPEIQNQVEIKIKNKDYRQVKGDCFQEGENFYIRSKFSLPKETKDIFNSYEIRPVLYYRTQDGTVYKKRIYNIRYQPEQFDFWDLLRYLREKGKL